MRERFVIRGAQPDEYDDIAHVWLESWKSAGLTEPADPGWEALGRRIRREIAAGWNLLVADDGDIAGFVALRRKDNCLDQLFVAPDRQGGGIGRALLAFARTQLPKEIWLRCASANHRAWAWYEREGFAFEKEAPHEASGMMLKYYRWRG